MGRVRLRSSQGAAGQSCTGYSNLGLFGVTQFDPFMFMINYFSFPFFQLNCSVLFPISRFINGRLTNSFYSKMPISTTRAVRPIWPFLKMLEL